MTILVQILENEVVVSVGVFLESNQTLIGNTIISFTHITERGSVRDMVFNATFNNMSVISWRSFLLVEEAGAPRENHRPVSSH